MDNWTAIYIFAGIITVLVGWAAYEIYMIRLAAQDLAVEVHEAELRKTVNITAPQLFDQEQQ